MVKLIIISCSHIASLVQGRYQVKNKKNQLKIIWRPIYSMVYGAAGGFILSNQNYIAYIFMWESYEKSTKYFKTRVSFIFRIQTWSLSFLISTGSINVNIYTILRKGSESDIYDFPPVNMHNRSHASKQTHNVGLKINTKSNRWHHFGTIIATESINISN